MNTLRIFLMAALILMVFGMDNVEASKEPEWFYDTGDQVFSVAISADGEYVVAGGNDDKVHLFDKDNSTPLWSYDTGFYSVDEVAISADGEYIATGNKKVRLFDKDNSTPLYETGYNVKSVAISADGEYIVAGGGGNDEKVYLFHRNSSTPLWSYKTEGWVYSVAISADGKYITAGSWDDNVYLFDKDSSTPLWSYETVDYVYSVAISADGEYIVAGSSGSDAKVYLFNKDSSTPLWSYTTGAIVYSVAISADGEYVVAGGNDEKVKLFNKDSSTPLWSYDTGSSADAVAISADGEYIVAGSQHVRLFDKDSSTPLWSYDTGSSVYSVAVSADGEYIAAGNYGGKVYFFDKSIPPTAEITRGLNLTAIDETQSIYPEYGGSSSQNSVKFKVKLENTGSHKDTYIPEIVSTLENDWSVSFWQDSGKTQSWSASGVDIEAGELDDLWIFVEVDDEADEGNYTIQFSVYDEDENPDARKDGDVTVTIIRPELTISPDNIRLEIDGVFGNASQAKDGDTVVVYVDVQNIGNADADDVKVEIYYYPKKTPTTQQEIDELLIAGFEFDEDINNYIYMLYSNNQNILSNSEKTIASDDWLIKEGEWYVEVRADYDEDNDRGAILESNENNNDARYPELLRIKSDLVIDTMRVDSRYGGENADTPDVDDIVTFTVTVTNSGAADVKGVRLYITADSSIGNEILKDRNNLEYIEFDIDAGDTTDVRFRWKAIEGEWDAFRAEINPACDDFNIFECETAGDGLAAETGHMFDELGRYTNNEYPRSGVFEQSGSEVKFDISYEEEKYDDEDTLAGQCTCPDGSNGQMVGPADDDGVDDGCLCAISEEEIFLPSISLIPALIAIGIIALRRRY